MTGPSQKSVAKGNQIVSATFRAHGGLCSLSEGWFSWGAGTPSFYLLCRRGRFFLRAVRTPPTYPDQQSRKRRLQASARDGDCLWTVIRLSTSSRRDHPAT